MYKIALVCQHGASTGMLKSNIEEVAERENIELEIKAYSITQIDSLITNYDLILLGPQEGYKIDSLKEKYSGYSHKIDVVNTMDFGMMNGEKVLNEAMAMIDNF